MVNCKKHGVLTEDQIRSYMTFRGGEWKYVERCRPCHRETASKARNRDRTKTNEWVRADRIANPEKYRQWQRNRRRTPEAKIKRSDQEIARRFGIEFDRYKEMFAAQNNVCAICKQSETRKSRSGGICRLVLDHCHETKKVRALLCHHCNLMIGNAKDSIELLEAAIQYLKGFKIRDETG